MLPEQSKKVNFFFFSRVPVWPSPASTYFPFSHSTSDPYRAPWIVNQSISQPINQPNFHQRSSHKGGSKKAYAACCSRSFPLLPNSIQGRGRLKKKATARLLIPLPSLHPCQPQMNKKGKERHRNRICQEVRQRIDGGRVNPQAIFFFAESKIIKNLADRYKYHRCHCAVQYRGLRVSEARPLWLAHRPIGQSKSRISSTFVPRVRLTFFHHEFSSQDWLFLWLHTRNFGQ
ncbi:hypothetical protein B9Z19DRAFT_795311 [Tuber borchii]|uniref:Uncharacterized protein n=1 Tax=Tuber borchii TaxID=42251 RepID=A0A2T6ZWB5_TUBBO|nr:hypothetical protein B9Z19DRAFT_795311 [Tuber borchii]